MKKISGINSLTNSLANENELKELNLTNDYIEDFSEDDPADENIELYKWAGILLAVIWILSIIFY